MTDPISAVSLGLGAASLAIQIFSGCEKGYWYFMSAANMTEECKVIKVRLLIEHSRLIDWGEATGLSDPNRHVEYDSRMKMNRDLIAAILGEIRLRLKSLTKSSLAYTDCLKPEDMSLFAEQEYESARLSDVTLISGGSIADTTPHRGLRKEDIQDIVQHYETVFDIPHIQTEELKSRKGFNHIIRMSKGIGKGVRDIAANPKRFKWALTDRKQMEKDLLRLKELNGFLLETVNGNQMKQLVETTNATWLGMLQLTESVNGLEELLIAYQEDIKATRDLKDPTFASCDSTLVGSLTGSLDTIRVSSNNTFTTYETLAKFAINATIALENPVEAIELSQNEQEAVVAAQDVDGGIRKFLTSSEKPTWIEWKYYDEITKSRSDGVTEYVPDPLTEKSIKRLVSLLQISPRPQEFCVPNCLGYFIDEFDDAAERGRFGILYQSNVEKVGLGRPVSLLDLLSGTRPSIQRRIQLAIDLTSCLTYLHAVNWLHKGIRSASILLFEDGSDGLGRICLSGLEYSRPNEPNLTQKPLEDNFSWGEYIHPGYLGYRRRYGYKRTYDIYSLGIILLEIAYWKPASSILSVQERNLSNLEKIRDQLLEDNSSILNKVKDDMGERYGSAVRICLLGMLGFGLDEGHDQREPAIAALIQQSFSRSVVDGLRSIIL